MKNKLKDRWRYKFEQFLSKGGSSIFKSLLIVFLLAFALISGLRLLLITIFPSLNYTGDAFKDIWITFLEMTATGSMQQDSASPTLIKVFTILAGLVGVVLLSMLIAFITTSLNKFLHEFRKGRGKIIESNHTLIFGWNERVVDIIKEVILANESEKDGCVVILSNEEKETMDDLITKRLTDLKTTRVITTSGDYANVNEHLRVNISHARSIIILADCSESAPLEEKTTSDVQSIKAILGIISNDQTVEAEPPIIAEIFTQEKRDLIGFFDYDNIITLDSWEIMGKLLIQTSLTSGLDAVYNEMLSFDGGEVYFHEDKWKGARFYDLFSRFNDGIPMGVYSEENGLQLRPDENYTMGDDDQLIIFAEDDSTIHLESSSQHSHREIPLADIRLEQEKKKILILGWHRVAEIYIREASEYLLEGSTVDIVYKDANQELDEAVKHLQTTFEDFNINLIQDNTLSIEALKRRDPYSYDNIIIMSQDMEQMSGDKVDSDTLIILLILRKLNNPEDQNNTKIITQVLNSDNKDIIRQTSVDDFIISNKLITMILAQLSEEPLLKELYDDLFSEDGSEIYVKPAKLYFTSFPQEVTFMDIIYLALKREEICLGVRVGSMANNPDQNFGVQLNPAKDKTFTINEDDFLVVLSEDEL